MDFMETPTYERFSTLSTETFEGMAACTGVPLELLMVVREATGSAVPQPTDFLREDELEIAAFLEVQVKLGFRPPAIERLLRVTGDSLRRIAAQEADWWMGEVMGPRMAQGMSMAEAANSTEPFNEMLTSSAEAALLATWHANQSYAWTSNIINGLEQTLAAHGLYTKLDRPPAMCFLDITGYTRLTQERGDEAAAELARRLSRLVQKVSVRYKGKPVKSPTSWAAEPSSIRPARWSAGEMAGRRRDVLLPRPGAGRGSRARHGRRRQARWAAAGARRPARGAGPLPGGRLLRADGQRCLTDC